jgi:sugar phosphate isomerase/epimerase
MTRPSNAINRRSFLASTAQATAKAAGKKKIKLGIATYSSWHFSDPKVSVETVIDKAGEIGVEGVDLLHRQTDLPEKEPLVAGRRVYLRQLTRRALRNGVCCVCPSHAPDVAHALRGEAHREHRRYQKVH